jgi:leucyl/phenylalanyl-tRNA--protein transferase
MSDAPGLLAAGGTLGVTTLVQAYRQGIFPWFSQGQPNLWWSPDPRMVLLPSEFRLHRSLRKTLQQFRSRAHCEMRFDTAFAEVIHACASTRQGTTGGTWILPQMQRAYLALHRAGYAHSVETWVDGRLVGGLYCVSIGRSVFGESMFSLQTDASKIALAALAAFCRVQGIGLIDCQQNTRHLASLGAQEMPRARFLALSAAGLDSEPPHWEFQPLYWQAILPDQPTIK